MHLRRIAALAVCALALAACARDRPAAPSRRALSATEPGFINGGDCPPSRHDDLPPDAGCVSSVAQGDDMLRVYALVGGDDKPRRWRIRFDSGGEPIDQRLRAGHVTSYPRAVGVTDVDDDGRPEWWVKVADYASHGAPWAGLGVFVVADGVLARITYEGGPLIVDFGGITRLGEGAICRDGRLVMLRAWALDRQNTRWRVSERTVELTGTAARLVDRRVRTFSVDSYTDPELVRNYRVQCDGATFTPFG